MDESYKCEGIEEGCQDCKFIDTCPEWEHEEMQKLREILAKKEESWTTS